MFTVDPLARSRQAMAGAFTECTVHTFWQLFDLSVIETFHLLQCALGGLEAVRSVEAYRSTMTTSYYLVLSDLPISMDT